MQTLNRNWITENHIDFEYKKYILLAYLQHVSENFTENRLYPYLSDLVEHYRNLKALKDNKNVLFNSFPDRMKAADLEQFRIIYEKMVGDDNLMQEIESIIDFSLPKMELYLKEGKAIYDFIEEQFRIFPIGVIPLSNEEGYMLLKTGASDETQVYEFHITLFENPNERFRGITAVYIGSYQKTLLTTFEAIKVELLRYNQQLPNPATYVIETELAIPFNETFLPIAKRCLVKTIAGNA